MKKDLSIIIVNYNSKKFLLPCLQSIKESVRAVNFEVIIVDNDSPDEKLSEEDFTDFPFAKLFNLEDNRGFGAGNNFGISKASGEYLLLLNPDTLLQDDSIQKMLAFHRKHLEIGALTCLLYQEDNKTLQASFYGKFQSLLTVSIRHYNYKKIDSSYKFFYTDIVTGGCLMIRKDLFDRIGGFDERIFMYLEDDDLCKRLVSLGYKNAVLNTAKIIHLEGKSSKNQRNKKKMYYKSQDYYWKKHNGVFVTAIMKIIRWPLKMIKTH